MQEITVNLLKGTITIRTRVTTLNVVTASVLDNLPKGGTHRVHVTFAVPEYTWEEETRRATMQELEAEYDYIREQEQLLKSKDGN